MQNAMVLRCDMNEFYIIGQQLPIKRKVKNKITGNIKEYEAYEVVDGIFFLCFDNKFLPKLIYEKVKDV
jgi:hypothetical protein